MKAARILFCHHQSCKKNSSEEEKAVDIQIMNRCLTFIFFGSVQVRFIETVLSGLAFTLCMDQIETQHGGGEKYSRTALLDTAVSSLGSCMRCFKGYDLALDSNFHALLGSGRSCHLHSFSIESIIESAEFKLGRESTTTGTFKGSEDEKMKLSQFCEELSDSESEDGERRNCEKAEGKSVPTVLSSSWLDKGDMPLLARPLLDSLLLILSLVHPSVMREEEELVHEKFEDVLHFQRSRVMGYSAAGQNSLRLELADEMSGTKRMQDRGINGDRADTVSFPQDQLYSYSEIPGAVGAAVRWLCIGHLVQLLVAEMVPMDTATGDGEDVRGHHPFTRSTSTPMSASTSPVNLLAEHESENSGPSLLDSNDTILSEWSVGRLCGELIDTVDSHLPQHFRNERTKGSAASTLGTGSIRTILKKWCIFLRSTLHILTICRPDLLLDICSATPPTQINKQSVSTYTQMCAYLPRHLFR